MAGFLCGLALICETWAFEVAVIPAKAGIHVATLEKCAVDGLDSRGNDRASTRAGELKIARGTS